MRGRKPKPTRLKILTGLAEGLARNDAKPSISTAGSKLATGASSVVTRREFRDQDWSRLWR
jgi:hypothetical protein